MVPGKRCYVDKKLREAIAGAEAYESLHVPSLFGMLAVATKLDARIDWRSGTAEELPVEDQTFDRVVSQFGMMFFADPERTVEEMVRALVPEGHFAIAVWDSLENTPAYAREVELLDRMAGVDAANALRAPFVLGSAPAVRDLIETASGCSVVVSTIVGRGRFPSIRSIVEADLRGWLPVMGVELEEDLILAILAAAEQELSEFVRPDGGTDFDSPAHVFTGRKAG
jgi:SAM-dependent methyltransferase